LKGTVMLRTGHNLRHNSTTSLSWKLSCRV